jgi:hypothetical protein
VSATVGFADQEVDVVERSHCISLNTSGLHIARLARAWGVACGYALTSS